MKRKLNRSQKFIKLQCSPSNKTKKYSCYSDVQLQNLKKMWNAGVAQLVEQLICNQ